MSESIVAGNVGINTTTPAYTLDVNGSARVSGALFTTNGNVPVTGGYNSGTITIPNNSRWIFSAESASTENGNYKRFHAVYIISIDRDGYMLQNALINQSVDASSGVFLSYSGTTLTVSMNNLYGGYGPLYYNLLRLQ